MKSKKRKGTIHSVDPVLFQRYLNSQEDHVLATLLCQWAFQPGLKFKSSHLWKHFVKWQKTDAEQQIGKEIYVPPSDNVYNQGKFSTTLPPV